MTDREELHLLSGAFALNALEGDEKARFEKYLVTSEEARTEVASLSDTAVLIGLATQPVAPPADLRSRLMAQIAVTPQLPAATEVAARQGTLATGIEPDGAGEVLSAGDSRTRSRASARAAARWYTRPGTILIAAAAAVALFVGGNILGLSAASQSQQQAAAISAIVAASDSQQAKAEVKGGGTATFVWSVSLRKSAVIIDKLPPLTGGKTYELWYIDRGSNATPAGTFAAASSGRTVSILQGAMTAGDTLGITIEPSGGSNKPTTAPIVAIASA